MYSLHVLAKTQEDLSMAACPVILNSFLPYLCYRTDCVILSTHVANEINILCGSKSTKKDRQWDVLWWNTINSVLSQVKLASSYKCLPQFIAVNREDNLWMIPLQVKTVWNTWS